MSDKVYNYVKIRNDTPKHVFRSSIDYNFLKYIKIVFKWAQDNHDLARLDIEVLLYLYSEGIFPQEKCMELYKLKGNRSYLRFRKLFNEGWLVRWRERRGNIGALYTLSNKGKLLCSRMHKICAGEETIPESPRSNVLAKDTSYSKKIYMNFISIMNKQVKERESE